MDENNREVRYNYKPSMHSVHEPTRGEPDIGQSICSSTRSSKQADQMRELVPLSVFHTFLVIVMDLHGFT